MPRTRSNKTDESPLVRDGIWRAKGATARGGEVKRSNIAEGIRIASQEVE